MKLLDTIKEYFRHTRKVSTYNHSPIESLKIISSPIAGENYNLGNCIKYLTRFLSTEGAKKRNPDCLMKVCHYAYFEMVRRKELINGCGFKGLVETYVDEFENTKVRYIGTDMTLVEAMDNKMGEHLLNDLIFNCDTVDYFRKPEDYFLIGYFLLERYTKDMSNSRTAILAWNYNTNKWEIRGEEGEVYITKEAELLKYVSKEIQEQIASDAIKEQEDKGLFAGSSYVSATNPIYRSADYPDISICPAFPGDKSFIATCPAVVSDKEYIAKCQDNFKTFNNFTLKTPMVKYPDISENLERLIAPLETDADDCFNNTTYPMNSEVWALEDRKRALVEIIDRLKYNATLKSEEDIILLEGAMREYVECLIKIIRHCNS